jgi:large subunit ribosomal protein L18
MATNNKRESRIRRHERVRKYVSGTEDKPRLAVFRSTADIYAQVIDDSKGITLVSASTIDHELKGKPLAKKTKSEQAKLVGSLVAERAQKKGIKKVVFDRGGFRYMGRVKALADAAREAGLDF